MGSSWDMGSLVVRRLLGLSCFSASPGIVVDVHLRLLVGMPGEGGLGWEIVVVEVEVSGGS